MLGESAALLLRQRRDELIERHLDAAGAELRLQRGKRKRDPRRLGR